MTDVEPKTPNNKRKNSFGNKNSAKKHGNANTPQKNQKVNTPFNNKKSPKGQQNTPQLQKGKGQQNTPHQQKANNTPQKQKTPKSENLLNGNAKVAQKQNEATPNKKVKPFPGTGNLQTLKIKKEKSDSDMETGTVNFTSKKIKKEKEDSSSPNKQTGEEKTKVKHQKIKKEKGERKEGKEGKKRRAVYAQLKDKVRQGDAEALASIREKIQGFAERQQKGDLSKTAKRKLSILQRLQRALEEKVDPAAAAAAKKKNVVAKQTNKPAQNQAPANKKQPKNKQQNKSAPPNKKSKLMVKEESDEEDEDESDDEDAEAEEDSDEGSDEEGEGSDEEDDDDEEEDDESEEDTPQPPPKKEVTSKSKNTVKDSNLPKKEIKIDDLKKKDLLPPKQSVKNKTRYVVFVGNIPYDLKKEDIVEHFQTCGEIRHIRIPTEKKSNKPRGFCYVEVADEESYQKCLSKHHSFMKGRRINVQYTHGGKKKGENEKKVVKAKNLKLQALRKSGKLSGMQASWSHIFDTAH
ncbi:unnamed protein product [Acanthoscelides obtectus]|uniref:RRM domain-containing protein n=1 Tax=Acanthoscelides obtectus TaxID=200917 RepID=A0A9P0K666_ACAOB|nr:unnamed protein product [Acanthoscelides obtectus]CAK1658216.1 Uncharacterized RNA-binding protein C365.04c [Acanthoscelides obtectus]